MSSINNNKRRNWGGSWHSQLVRMLPFGVQHLPEAESGQAFSTFLKSLVPSSFFRVSPSSSIVPHPRWSDGVGSHCRARANQIGIIFHWRWLCTHVPGTHSFLGLSFNPSEVRAFPGRRTLDLGNFMPSAQALGRNVTGRISHAVLFSLSPCIARRIIA